MQRAFSLVEKININFNFGGSKKIEVRNGDNSKRILLLSSTLKRRYRKKT